MTATTTVPNVKALRRILYALILSAILCFGICLALIANTKPQAQDSALRRVPCHCANNCMRARER